MKDGEFKCSTCNGIFKKGWSDEEAMAETRENFGDTKREECEVVCDDCYEKMFPHFPEIKKELENDD